MRYSYHYQTAKKKHFFHCYYRISTRIYTMCVFCEAKVRMRSYRIDVPTAERMDYKLFPYQWLQKYEFIDTWNGQRVKKETK